MMIRRLSALALLVVAPLAAAEPNIRTVNFRGLQIGGTTEINIDGDDLGKSPKLLLPFPAKQTLKPGSTEKQATFEIVLDESVPAGYHNLRVVTDGGVSLPVPIGVEAMPQRPFGPLAGPLPVVLHGTVGGSAVLETTFAGKAKQRVMIEVESHRLVGKLRPVIHLYGPKKLQLAWSWPSPMLLGDTRLAATLPEDGTYTMTLHDAEYAAPAPAHFRLKLGEWRSVDRVFPPVASAETKSVELLGTGETMRLDLAAQRDPFQPLPWPKGQLWSGARPIVESSARPEFVAPIGRTSLPGSPFAVSGRFQAAAAEERFRVPVQPGTRLRLEVFAERLGSPVDAALVIRNEGGSELARAEDGPGTLDPVLEYAVPDKVNAIVVGVYGFARRGTSEAIYRFVVDPVGGTKSNADFHLSTPTLRIALPMSGRAVVPIHVERHGYAGTLDLSADRIPSGIKLDGTTIPSDSDGALVTVSRESAFAEASVVELRGRAENGAVRQVFSRGHPMERLQPWLAAELAIAPSTGKADDFAIDWRGLPQGALLKPTARLALPVSVRRLDPASPVRLTLLTSQAPILVNNQPDAARTIRVEKPVELAAKVSDGELTILLPALLPANGYDLAVQAELLSTNKQRVLATAFTPVRRLAVQLPITLKLDDPAKRDVTLDAKTGATIEVKGEIVRAEGIAGDATVAATGIPVGATVAPVIVKAGETKFTFKLALLPTTPTAVPVVLKLSASVVPDPKQPNVRVASRDITFTLNIAGAK